MTYHNSGLGNNEKLKVDADYHFLKFVAISQNGPKAKKMFARTRVQQVFCDEIYRQHLRFAGLNPTGICRFFSECKNPEHDFLQKGSEDIGPVS